MYWPHDPAHPVTKVCTKCGEEKPFPLFHLRYETGRRRAVCRVCYRAGGREAYRAHPERYLAAKRRYYAAHRAECDARTRAWRLCHRENTRGYLRRYRRENRWKTLVRRATYALRQVGVIERPTRCADCGGRATEHHHTDYSSPFALVALCRRCHMARHFAEWRRHGGGPVKYPRADEGDAAGPRAPRGARKPPARRARKTKAAAEGRKPRTGEPAGTPSARRPR